MRVVKKGSTKHMILFMKYRGRYQFETSVITMKSNDVVTKMETNTSLTRVNKLMRIFPGIILTLCPDTTVDMVYATPEDGIPTAVAGVEDACLTAESKGYKCKTLIGDEATVQAYKRYLSYCPKLKALGSIGHGNTGGILLHNNQVLDHNWFTSLSSTKLKKKVLYFNSCQVHNAPLEPAIMSAGTRSYIAGHINLGIGTSEEVFKCFWDRSLTTLTGMKPALEGCEDDLYPTSGAHGFSGFEWWFKPLIIRPFPRPRPRPFPRPIALL